MELPRISTKHQLSQFKENLYEQVDDVANGSPLGPLMADGLLCSIEDTRLPEFSKRYVDDTLGTVPDIPAATEFLSTLNDCHPEILWSWPKKKPPFLGMEIFKRGCRLKTMAYRQPTDTGLLLHNQCQVDHAYKRLLLKTMLNRAYRLSSPWELSTNECEHLKVTRK